LEVGFRWDNGSREGKVFEALMAKGQEAWKAQKWEFSLQCYGSALLLRPNDPEALQGRGKALELYNRQRAEIYFNQGRKAEDRGYFLEAQRDYDWALNLRPGEMRYSAAMDRIKKSLAQGGALSNPKVQSLLERAIRALKKGGNRTAIKDIKEARRLYPKDAFLSYLAKTFNEKDYAALAPKDKEVQRLAVEAEIYRNKGRTDLANAAWKKILEKDPGNAMARENLEEGEGVSVSSGLSDTDRARSRALLQKGLKAYANGNPKEAVEDWEAVLKIDPHNVNALNNLTRLKMEEGEAQP
jgi:tetratricopeptide (TPR) repeat protein